MVTVFIQLARYDRLESNSIRKKRFINESIIFCVRTSGQVDSCRSGKRTSKRTKRITLHFSTLFFTQFPIIEWKQLPVRNAICPLHLPYFYLPIFTSRLITRNVTICSFHHTLPTCSCSFSLLPSAHNIDLSFKQII